MTAPDRAPEAYPAAYVNPVGPVQQLHVIPDLATELFWTIDAPNPGERAARTPHVAGPRIPINADALDLLAPPSDDPIPATASIGRDLLVGCVRLVVEEMDDAGHEPPAWPSDTWAGLCGWLLATHSWWSLQPWADDIAHDVETVARALTRACRLRRDLELQCPICADVLRPQPGGQWLLCDSGHEVEGAGAIARRMRLRPALPTADICAEFGITRGQLDRWRSGRAIRPVCTERGAETWMPWDVFCLLNPTVAEVAATTREGA